LASQDTFLLSVRVCFSYVKGVHSVQLNHNRSLVDLAVGGIKSLWNISTFLPVISLVTNV